MGSWTNSGEQTAMLALVTAVTRIRAYTAASVPSKTGVEGVAFIEAANGNGYTTGGKTIIAANWTWSVVDGIGRYTLATQTWTAAGGNIANVAGFYIVDVSNAVKAWWDQPPATVLDGGQLLADGLYLKG